MMCRTIRLHFYAGRVYAMSRIFMIIMRTQFSAPATPKYGLAGDQPLAGQLHMVYWIKLSMH